jgi:hypothetical protein
MMLQLTHTKVPLHIAPSRRRETAIARPRAEAPATDIHRNAAPLTLAAVVGGGLLLAVAMAIVTAVGG